MPKKKQFSLKIETKLADLSAERFAQYLEQFTRLVGSQEAVRFDSLKEGSSEMVVYAIDRDEEAQIYARLKGNAETAKDLHVFKRAKNTLNQMMLEDRTCGEVKVSGRKSSVIDFPGINTPPEDPIIVRETGTIQGKLISADGKDDSKNFRVLTHQGEMPVTAMLEVAERLKGHLWHQVRLTGKATWRRLSDGTWKVRTFHVESYEPLDETPLAVVTREIHDQQAELWAVEDPLNEIRTIREN